jgi:hypothetical protein
LSLISFTYRSQSAALSNETTPARRSSLSRTCTRAHTCPNMPKDPRQAE